jgi:hypothetical protein
MNSTGIASSVNSAQLSAGLDRARHAYFWRFS